MAGTRPYSSVNGRRLREARERQLREIKRRKQEKLIFAAIVVTLIVMILFAILIFKKLMGDPVDTEAGHESDTVDTSGETEARDPATALYGEETLAKRDLYAGALLLIDPSHKFQGPDPVLENAYASHTKFDKPGSSNGFVYSIYQASQDQQLEKDTLAALNALADDFYRATGNYDLYIHTNSAYVAGAADEHATGRAVDLSVFTIDEKHYALDDPEASEDFQWVLDNYHRYGFILNASCACAREHSHHLLYVGQPHAEYMRAEGLTLAQYLAKLEKDHTATEDGSKNLTVTASDGAVYEVYYVAVEGDMAKVPVPREGTYTVSGDNVGGFIVTVTVK